MGEFKTIALLQSHRRLWSVGGVLLSATDRWYASNHTGAHERAGVRVGTNEQREGDQTDGNTDDDQTDARRGQPCIIQRNLVLSVRVDELHARRVAALHPCVILGRFAAGSERHSRPRGGGL